MEMERFLSGMWTITEAQARAAGRDYATNGATERNCHFAFFTRPELTRAWEAGARRQQEATHGASE